MPYKSSTPLPPDISSDSGLFLNLNKKFKFTDSALDTPSINEEWRNKLLDIFFEYYESSNDLGNWLKKLGLETKGSINEKVARIRDDLKFATIPAADFPDLALSILDNLLKIYKRSILEDICKDLGLDTAGPAEARSSRINREIGYQEKWLIRYQPGTPITKKMVCQVIEWNRNCKIFQYEKDYYPEFQSEMAEIFGVDNVHAQHTVAHGAPLKIDFHIGHPLKGGIGVEFKMPCNISDIQKAVGQLDIYLSRYNTELIVMAYTHKLKTEVSLQVLVDALEMKEIYCLTID